MYLLLSNNSCIERECVTAMQKQISTLEADTLVLINRVYFNFVQGSS